jgi:hypothetical protein
MVDILAWADVRKLFHVTTDTAQENAIHVHFSGNRF